jgi:hypothetical protein
MSVDWWARGLGIAGIVLAAGTIIWHWFEWWIAGRARLKVVASAGRFQWSPHFSGILYGKGVEASSIIITVINTSRRVVTVQAVGFLQRRGEWRCLLAPLPGRRFPATLGQGENVSGWADPETFVEALRSGARLVPFCKDTEGKIHKGKEDEHFRRFRRRATEATNT